MAASEGTARRGGGEELDGDGRGGVALEVVEKGLAIDEGDSGELVNPFMGSVLLNES